MHGNRRKNAWLAINAIIRGLEFDEIAFRYDESAHRDEACSAAVREALMAIEARARQQHAAE